MLCNLLIKAIVEHENAPNRMLSLELPYKRDLYALKYGYVRVCISISVLLR